jgi:hypothetical protein
VDRTIATKITEEHVARLSGGEVELILFPEQTMERGFGWVFFYDGLTERKDVLTTYLHKGGLL